MASYSLRAEYMKVVETWCIDRPSSHLILMFASKRKAEKARDAICHYKVRNGFKHLLRSSVKGSELHLYRKDDLEHGKAMRITKVYA